MFEEGHQLSSATVGPSESLGANFVFAPQELVFGYIYQMGVGM